MAPSQPSASAVTGASAPNNVGPRRPMPGPSTRPTATSGPPAASTGSRLATRGHAGRGSRVASRPIAASPASASTGLTFTRERSRALDAGTSPAAHAPTCRASTEADQFPDERGEDPPNRQPHKCPYNPGIFGRDMLNWSRVSQKIDKMTVVPVLPVSDAISETESPTAGANHASPAAVAGPEAGGDETGHRASRHRGGGSSADDAPPEVTPQVCGTLS